MQCSQRSRQKRAILDISGLIGYLTQSCNVLNNNETRVSFFLCSLPQGTSAVGSVKSSFLRIG